MASWRAHGQLYVSFFILAVSVRNIGGVYHFQDPALNSVSRPSTKLSSVTAVINSERSCYIARS
jgi:hypothetical protein